MWGDRTPARPPREGPADSRVPDLEQLAKVLVSDPIRPAEWDASEPHGIVDYDTEYQQQQGRERNAAA